VQIVGEQSGDETIVISLKSRGRTRRRTSVKGLSLLSDCASTIADDGRDESGLTLELELAFMRR